MVDAEDLSDEEVEELLTQFRELHEHYGQQKERSASEAGHRKI